MANIIGAILFGVKLVLLSILLAVLAKFLSFLVHLIPPLELNGCIGHYFDIFGMKDGLNWFISILVYGFTFKFGLSFFKTYL